jgi:hypothetical protein
MTRDDFLIWTLPALVAFMFVCLWRASREDGPTTFRLTHFFTGPEGRGSAASLLVVLGALVGIWLVWWFAIHDTLTEWILNVFYWFCGGVGVGKIAHNAAIHIGNKTMPTPDAGDVPQVRKGDDV